MTTLLEDVIAASIVCEVCKDIIIISMSLNKNLPDTNINITAFCENCGSLLEILWTPLGVFVEEIGILKGD